MSAAAAARADARFVPVEYGVDDISLGFDMAGSGCVRRLNELPGLESRRGKMLGERTSWSQWSGPLGRSAAFWKADTGRLYVQAKLAEPGQLIAPRSLEGAIRALMERMAVVGLVCYEEPWVTRLDIAVDAECASSDGKLLLDALEAVRPPNGWRISSAGVPRSTVYFRARASEAVNARAYCRNLKNKSGAPFGLIRLEAEQRFEPRRCPLERACDVGFMAGIWMSRFGQLSSSVTRLAREQQMIELAARVVAGQLRYAAAERMGAFLDLERLGLGDVYPAPVRTARRREAARLGLSANDPASEPLDVPLDELLAPYLSMVEATMDRSNGSPAGPASVAPDVGSTSEGTVQLRIAQ